ncbi:cyclin G-like [Daphnia pulex]|uniref:cyclin G-like n=1 Tax=Daphnia pulex TaxID=6669 RepID=UPI001EDEF1F2|nr:cyclin G-like [Daphnia pulex]XP_046440622.1 cyclin G-like [Daphnia pulex]
MEVPMDVAGGKSSCPDVSTLVQSLQQALALEAKFQPKLQLPSTASNTGESGEITCAMRDGAAHVLRCLKVWYDLPSAVLLDALNMMDRFMSRMKARPKHLSCIAISSFHLAACQWVERVKQNNNEASSIQSPLQVVPEPQDLVTISQCKCTAGDINRMEKIVEAKLACLPQEEPVTTLTFLNLYHSLLSTTLPAVLQPDLLILSCKLETICCDANYAAFPSSLLAFALLFVEMKCHQPAIEVIIRDVLLELQRLVQVKDDKLKECIRMVTSVMAPYDGYAQSNPSHRQRLTWKLSRRTLKQLRPTEKLVNVLPTIEENRQFGQVQKRSRRSRLTPHKMRPVSPGAVLSSLPLPFPTKEDLTSFFDNFVAASPYSFRFLYGLEEESPSTA